MCKVISFEKAKNMDADRELYNSACFIKKMDGIKPENIKNICLIANAMDAPAIQVVNESENKNEVINFPIIEGFQIHYVNGLLRKLDLRFDMDLHIEFKTYLQYDNLIREVNLKLHGLTKAIQLNPSVEDMIDEIKTKKFNVISHIGMTKKGRNRKFFIVDVIQPTKYGADCKDYTWYEVILKTDDDYKQAKDFIEELFKVQCTELNKDNCIQVVEALEKELQKKAKIEDWGGCHVTHLPYAEQFRRVGE